MDLNQPLFSFKELNTSVKNNRGKVFFLVDENTHEYCLQYVLQNLEDLNEFEILEVPSGEASKDLDIAQQLWLTLKHFNADRNALLINVGGGVITDLGGFVAALFLRGISFVHVPTSLLAMVDAAHGGKTGVDLEGAKNMVGSFSLPLGVFLDAHFLATLPKEHILSGKAEMLKHGLIANSQHFEAVSEAPEITTPLILDSAQIKLDVVKKDLRESGMRKILNFGHTLGHAIESYKMKQGQPVLHGQAVAAGIICASFLSVLKETGLTQKELQTIVEVFLAEYKKIELPNLEAVLNWLKFDKKNANNELYFVLLSKIGEAKYNQKILMEEAHLALQFYQNL